jgi:homoserine O-acetyltransferase
MTTCVIGSFVAYSVALLAGVSDHHVGLGVTPPANSAGVGGMVKPVGSDLPGYTEGEFEVRDFRFRTGDRLPSLKTHYVTIGTPKRDGDRVTNAVLLLHGTTGSGTQFLQPSFARVMFGPGQPLDATKYYLILPDGIGHGGSSKPSDGLRAKFPRYDYRDMVEAQRKLVTEKLGVKRLRLVLGTSMGGMHTWMWGTLYPDEMDSLMPVACLPAPIGGRNLYWRRIIITAIKNDPAYEDGEYETQPPALAAVWPAFKLMTDCPAHLAEEAPTIDKADALVRRTGVEAARSEDANDVVYEFEASRDYDPSADLDKIKARLLTINFADDELNLPGFPDLDQVVKQVKGGRSVVIPATAGTQGHSTLRLGKVWGKQVAEFLADGK